MPEPRRRRRTCANPLNPPNPLHPQACLLIMTTTPPPPPPAADGAERDAGEALKAPSLAAIRSEAVSVLGDLCVRSLSVAQLAHDAGGLRRLRRVVNRVAGCASVPHGRGLGGWA